MKESNEYKEVLIRDGYYWKGKALGYEAILRAAGLFKEPPVLRFDDLGKVKKMSSDEVAKKIAGLIAENVQLTQINELLDKENKRLKHNMQMVSRNSYMRGWNEASKKMRNFITRHMSDYWKEEYENHD